VSTADGPEPKAPGMIPDQRYMREVIEAVRQPLGLFTLVILILFLLLTGIVATGRTTVPDWTVPLLVLVICVTLFSFVGVLIYDPGRLYQPPPPPPGQPAPPDPSVVIPAPVEFKKPDAPSADRADEWEKMYGAGKPPPDMDQWYRKLRPTLHQASFYTVPTYYLDRDLNVLDFNVAFELVFETIAGWLRGRHVNHFISELANRDEVLRHGIKFSDRVATEGRFPFVDLEPIVYDSAAFGRVEFTKVASQLHNADGRLQGWAVALMIRGLADWDKFERELEKKLFQDKLWSVYAGPYDRILPAFPAYTQLIKDVLAVLPAPGMCVGDFGAGTGNVTLELSRRGHRVYAVENNIGMLDRLAVKTKGDPNVSLVKASVEHLDCFKDAIFDAVTMVNVLYALDDPLGCLRGIHRVLKPGGLLGFSTTHRGTDLTDLLDAIKANGTGGGKSAQFLADYDILERVNREIGRTIAKRHTKEDYRSWVKLAGFDVLYSPEEDTYHNAVMLVHAKKKA
jgi:ubiquinone/menaquinone biosynthesis C-methylase UbiE